MLLASLCSKNLLKMQKVSFFQEFSFQVSSKNAKSQERPRLIFKKEVSLPRVFLQTASNTNEETVRNIQLKQYDIGI